MLVLAAIGGGAFFLDRPRVLHASLESLGQGAIMVFTGRVFRAGAGWARALVCALFGGLGALAL